MVGRFATAGEGVQHARLPLRQHSDSRYVERIVGQPHDCTLEVTRFQSYTRDMLRLNLLGGLSLEDTTGAMQPVQQRKALALLAVIAMAPHAGITREKLLGYFWPDAPEAKGKNALRQRLFALRRELGLADLVLGTQELRLNPDRIAVDVWEFQRELEQGAIDRALQLYVGPFLDGVYFLEMPELERWVDDTRTGLLHQARSAARRSAMSAAQQGQTAAALWFWQHAVALDPTATDLMVEVLRAHAAVNDVPGAIVRFRHYQERMQRELELPPDPMVVQVFEEIRSSQPRTIPSERPTATTVVSASDPEPEADVPITAHASPVKRAVLRRRGVLWFGIPILAICGAFVVQRRGVVALPQTTATRVLVSDFTEGGAGGTPASLAMQFQGEVARTLARSGAGDILDARLLLSADQRELGLIPAAKALGARFVVNGSLSRSGDSVTAKAAVLDGYDGTIIAVLPPSRQPSSSIDSLAHEVANRIAGSLAMLQDPLYLNSTGPLADPPNLTAYREYMSGIGLASLNDFRGATTRFLTAYRADTTFAHAALWALEGDVADSTRVSIKSSLATRRLDMAPIDRARFDFRIAYDDRRLNEAFQAAQEMVSLAPNSNHALHTLALMALESRRVDEAAAIMRRVDTDSPRGHHWASFFELGATVFEVAGDLDNALRFASASMRVLPDPFMCGNVLRVHVIAGRRSRALRDAHTCVQLGARDTALARLDVHHNLARALALTGEHRVADSLLESSVSIAEAAAARGALGPRRLAEVYADGGRFADAVRLYTQQLAVSPDALVPAQAAIAAIAAMKAGDSVRYRQFTALVHGSPRPRPRHLYTAHLAMAAGLPDSALASLARFANDGGLVIRQLHGEPRFAAIRNRPEWRALFTPISDR